MPTIASGTYLPAKPRSGRAASVQRSSAPACRCHECGDILIRVPRRLVDRLLSAFAPVRRFRCSNLLCLWEGNLRQSRMMPEASPSSVEMT
jgi:hypothetical protein